MKVKRFIGIDFGTSSTYIKVKHYEDEKTAKEDTLSAQYVDFNGNAWVPTIIQELGDDYWYGYDAQTKKSEDAVIHRNFKMSLEDKDEKTKNQAKYLTELFFSYIFHMYQDQFSYDKYDEIETIVSYPAKWQEETIEFMIDTAKKAGFQNVKKMDEPTAALNAVMIQNTSAILKIANIKPNKQFYIMMIDMGAGTTDLAVLKCFLQKANDGSGHILSRIISTWPNGDEHFCFGGREIEIQLHEYLLKYLLSLPNVSEKMAKNILSPQMDNIKSWKENTVSSALNKDIEVSNCPFLSPILPLITDEVIPFPNFGRLQFEKEFEKYLESFVELINGCMVHTKEITNEFNGMQDIDMVILTGGHSQWYFVKDILSGTIKTIRQNQLNYMPINKDKIFLLPRPQETVSLGLVYSPLRLKMDAEDEQIIDFDETEESYSYVNFNKVIYKVDTIGQDIPLHLKWIELEDCDHPDSIMSIINKKYYLTLSRYSYSFRCIYKHFMFLDAHEDYDNYIMRINLEDSYPNPEIIYKTKKSIRSIIAYKGVLYVIENKNDKETISQMSLDGTKKRLLFDLENIKKELGGKLYFIVNSVNKKYVYGSSLLNIGNRSGINILQINYEQKPASYKLIDEISNHENVFVQGENIYYYNESDGICVMNSETKQKRCLLRGKYQLWGVSNKRIIFSDMVIESYNGIYSMDFNGSNKNLILNKMVEKAMVVGEWVLFLGKMNVANKAGAFLEWFVYNSFSKPYCIRTDGTKLNPLF